MSVERGLEGIPGTKLEYVAMCHFLFDTFESFMEAFSPNAPVLQGDLPNYTDIESVIQISEVAISR